MPTDSPGVFWAAGDKWLVAAVVGNFLVAVSARPRAHASPFSCMQKSICSSIWRPDHALQPNRTLLFFGGVMRYVGHHVYPMCLAPHLHTYTQFFLCSNNIISPPQIPMVLLYLVPLIRKSELMHGRQAAALAHEMDNVQPGEAPNQALV